ncbi:MAG: HDIG domain-containing protein [Anaerolineae bacterium]|nr:HDIG domain-containing protein [Anaerolineae bacterium]
MRRVTHHWWEWARLILLGIVLAGISAIVMVFPLLPTEQVVIEAGGVAPRDVRAPDRVSYASAILTAEQEERAAAAVAPIYTDPDPALARQQFDRARQVLDYLGTVRADALASPAQQRGLIGAVPELSHLSAETLNNLLDLSDDGWDRVEHETLRVIGVAMRLEIREHRLPEVLEEIPDLVSLDLSDGEVAVTVALVRSFLVPNSFYDPEATEDARQQARESVGAVLRTFEADQVIVRAGEIVEPLDIEVMDQLGLRQPQTRWTDFVGAILLALLGTALVFLYLARFRSGVLWSGQQLLLLVLLVSLFALGEWLMVPGGDILRYLSPAPAMAMLVVATLGPHAGVAAALFLGCVAGAIAGNSLEVVTYTVVGGIVAALTLGRVERIGALFRAGGFVSLALALVVLVFRLPQGVDVLRTGELLVTVLAGIGNGMLSASLALGGLFLIGPLFDIATTLRLIELSRPDNPLLQRLLREAPATYHHSLMVASLAEQAAERIGADTLLTRVGAYYHDVGKITRPYFFAENQVEGVNPHDRLDPRTSAEVIVSHVKDGIVMGRRSRLPRRVRDFIPEHHGTTWVSFLYDKAVQLAGDATAVDADDFRHQGPKPQSKETALVMLADGCEAAVRAIRPTSAEEVAEIVSRVFSDRVSDGQLGECDLTLYDLEVAREAFISALKGVFHPRIQYPRSESGTVA